MLPGTRPQCGFALNSPNVTGINVETGIQHKMSDIGSGLSAEVPPLLALRQTRYQRSHKNRAHALSRHGHFGNPTLADKDVGFSIVLANAPRRAQTRPACFTTPGQVGGAHLQGPFKARFGGPCFLAIAGGCVPIGAAHLERGQCLAAFRSRSIRVLERRSCHVNRSRSIQAHQNPAPASSNETLPIA